MKVSIPMANDWFKTWFASEDYLKVYNHRDSKDAQNLAALIINSTAPAQGDFILDAACGAGRHGIHFASAGFRVIGFDLSKSLLLKANEEAMNLGVKLELIQADIRNICFRENFFLILNLFTSFGYFETDEENFLFVKHSTGFLKGGGFYVLDYFNKHYLEMNLVPESRKIVDNIKVVEKRKIENGRVIKKIELTKGSESKIFYESVRLYDWKFVVDKFSEYGFKIFKMFGGYNGADFNENTSPRLLVIFQL